MAGTAKEFWIQIEHHDWDTQPNKIDRMDTSSPPPADVVKDALILRRYTANWASPDDRKVNPWDLNEPDPTKIGTIPGPVLECNVGDEIVVHFRNQDLRATPDFVYRAHSLHPHGVVFPTTYDGAYPLSPPDATQPIATGDPEEPAWASMGVTGFKQGDRVPPCGTFTYKWSTFGWPTTAGVWLYHDHSVWDASNTLRGAIGFIVVHNPKDEDDVIDQDLPRGDPNGALTVIDAGGVARFVAPPTKALYLQLFHELHDDIKNDGRGSYINGRRNLGNTPTLIGGTATKMRFGVGAMNMSDTHTFHIHGHRWVIPGPSGDKVGGTTPPGSGVQVSTLNQAASQFEDTKLIGPANTFSMTINQGTFMGPPIGNQKGEWHMHCHILDHMANDGMMGSLLIVDKGDPLNLPAGKIPMGNMGMGNPPAGGGAGGAGMGGMGGMAVKNDKQGRGGRGVKGGP
jgi:FtsP/CotA-like multicopper oxidase with cupredoxin domain